MNETIKLRVAAKALIINDEGRALILREAKTYKDGTNIGRYHLPGGRLEAGEAFYKGLAREVKEETGLEIIPVRPLHVGEWQPTIQGVPHQIIAMFMLCQAQATNTVLSDEHDEALWIDPATYEAYDIMAPEDEVIRAYLDTK